MNAIYHLGHEYVYRSQDGDVSVPVTHSTIPSVKPESTIRASGTLGFYCL